MTMGEGASSDLLLNRRTRRKQRPGSGVVHTLSSEATFFEMVGLIVGVAVRPGVMVGYQAIGDKPPPTINLLKLLEARWLVLRSIYSGKF